MFAYILCIYVLNVTIYIIYFFLNEESQLLSTVSDRGRMALVASICSSLEAPEYITIPLPMVTTQSPNHVCGPGRGSKPVQYPNRAAQTGSISITVDMTTDNCDRIKVFQYRDITHGAKEIVRQNHVELEGKSI